MSRLLALETSSEICSVAISIDGELRERNFHEPRKHAELLLPTVAELLTEAGLKLQDLDAVAFGRGPGSFTSLRIGIGVVQGLAWGAELGVVPVSSLAALAQGVTRQANVSEGCRIVAAMDARMDEVFNATFRMGAGGQVIPGGPEKVEPPEKVNLPESEQFIAAGNGFERYPELAAKPGDDTITFADVWPTAADVLVLAKDWLGDNAPLPAHQAQPLYIRDNVAKKSGEQ